MFEKNWILLPFLACILLVLAGILAWFFVNQPRTIFWSALGGTVASLVLAALARDPWWWIVPVVGLYLLFHVGILAWAFATQPLRTSLPLLGGVAVSTVVLLKLESIVDWFVPLYLVGILAWFFLTQPLNAFLLVAEGVLLLAAAYALYASAAEERQEAADSRSQLLASMMVRCSRCGHEFIPERGTWRKCPHCGAYYHH
jgi:hypothetical protein